MCLTPACVEAASRILTSIDPTADPCFDMARFACGGWNERTLRTPNSNQVVMVLENLQSRVDHELRRKSAVCHLVAVFKISRLVWPLDLFCSCVTFDPEFLDT